MHHPLVEETRQSSEKHISLPASPVVERGRELGVQVDVVRAVVWLVPVERDLGEQLLPVGPFEGATHEDAIAWHARPPTQERGEPGMAERFGYVLEGGAPSRATSSAAKEAS